MPKTPTIHAILNAKCPRCRRGNIFSTSMYGWKLQKTNEFCEHCKMRFEVEPGYFYVAMYVSYSFNVIEMLIVGMLTYYLSNGSESPWLYIVIILTAIIFLAPLNYRYSRVFLLHWLTPKVKYNPIFDRDDKI